MFICQLSYALGKLLPMNVDLFFSDEIPSEIPEDFVPLRPNPVDTAQDSTEDRIQADLPQRTRGWWTVVKEVVKEYYNRYASEMGYEESLDVVTSSENPRA